MSETAETHLRQILQQGDSLKLNLTQNQVAILSLMRDSLFKLVDTLAVKLEKKILNVSRMIRASIHSDACLM